MQQQGLGPGRPGWAFCVAWTWLVRTSHRAAPWAGLGSLISMRMLECFSVWMYV